MFVAGRFDVMTVEVARTYAVNCTSKLLRVGLLSELIVYHKI